MKFHITVELLHEGKPVTPKDLKSFGTINFVKAAPKAFRRAMKATCWPFDANIKIELIDEPKEPTNGKELLQDRKKR